HLLDDSHAFDVVLKAGDVIEAEAAQVAVAARIDAQAELVDGELVLLIVLAVNREDFAHAIERHDAPDRRRGGGTEHAMIATGIAPDDGGGGESAQAVGEQP